MGIYVANQVIKLMIKKDHKVSGAKVLVLGITFKENCPDIRNSRVIDVINELQGFGCNISVSDYWADAQEVKQEYGLDLIKEVKTEDYAAVILTVGHDDYKNMRISNDSQVVYDVKSVLSKADATL